MGNILYYGQIKLRRNMMNESYWILSSKHSELKSLEKI